MGSVIGQILPLALGIAISPIPIIAAILMLLSPKAKTNGVGFAIGWVVGVIVAVTVFTLLAGILPQGTDNGNHIVVGIIEIVLGALLVLMAIRQWRGRPKKGEEPTMPKWMAGIDKLKMPVAIGLGFVLSAINPKNLLLAVSAGVAIGSAGLTGAENTIVIAVFTVIAASTVLVPVIGYLFAADKLGGPLDALREWLTKENALIMTLLLLVIGVVVIGKGIGAL